jgi:5-methylthioadenosine/S-adenosylhomocysteine deaminase
MGLLIVGGLIVTPDGAGVRAERGSIAVEGGRIARVAYGPEARTLATGPADRVIDASRRLVIPGLVDAHCHLYGALAPGLVDRLPLDIRMPALAATIVGCTDHDTRVATLLGALRMLRGGTTTVLENVLQGVEATEAVIRALLESGMRAVVGPMLADRPFHETLPGYLDHLPGPRRVEALGQPTPSPKELLEAAVAIGRQWHGAEGRVRVCLSPSTPHRCTDALLELVAESSAATGLPVHTHLLETRVQAVAGRRLYGRTMVEHVKTLGLLGPQLSCAHAVWLTDRDLDLLAEAAVGVSHNPLSNLYLGSGIARLPELLGRGVAVGLGSDGPNCGASMPLFEIMKLAACVHRLGEPDGDRWPTVQDAFRMATIGGARAHGLDREIGSIEAGKRADLVLLDADAPNFTPLNDPVTQLVYGETGQSVRTVLVGGEVVLEDGRPTRFDADAVIAEARERGARLRERARLALAQVQETERHRKGAYLALVREFDAVAGEYSFASAPPRR